MNTDISSTLSIVMNVLFAAGSAISTVLHGKEAIAGIKLRMADDGTDDEDEALVFDTDEE